MPYAINKGVKIYYEEKGAGLPVILSHSFFCSTKMWRLQFEELSKYHRVINVDIRGHGKSDKSNGKNSEFDLYTLVEDNLAVLDSLGIEKAVWAGLSIVGMISLRACLNYPERVIGLVLVDTDADKETFFNRFKYLTLVNSFKMLTKDPENLPGLLRKTIAIVVSKEMFGKTCFKQNFVLVREWRDEFARNHMPSMIDFMNVLCCRDSVVSRLHEIEGPVWIIVGQEDRALPPRCSEKLYDGIVGSGLTVLPGCGHLSSLENPEKTNQTLLDFLGNF